MRIDWLSALLLGGLLVAGSRLFASVKVELLFAWTGYVFIAYGVFRLVADLLVGKEKQEAKQAREVWLTPSGLAGAGEHTKCEACGGLTPINSRYCERCGIRR